MGQYFIIANPAKRQYLRIFDFLNNNQKASGVLMGEHVLAVAVLVCQLDEVYHTYGPLAGSWAGDHVIATGDEAKPNLYGLQTATESDPWRNLYLMAHQEFENITLQAIAMLCRGNRVFLRDIVQQIKGSGRGDALLRSLGDTVFQIGCAPLEQALIEELGPDWPKQYKALR